MKSSIYEAVIAGTPAVLAAIPGEARLFALIALLGFLAFLAWLKQGRK